MPRKLDKRPGIMIDDAADTFDIDRDFMAGGAAGKVGMNATFVPATRRQSHEGGAYKQNRDVGSQFAEGVYLHRFAELTPGSLVVGLFARQSVSMLIPRGTPRPLSTLRIRF